MYVLTLVSSKKQPDFDVAVQKALNITLQNRTVLDVGIAVDWFIEQPLTKDVLDNVRDDFAMDVFQQRVESRPKKLFLADMDSTIVQGETLDDMAACAGLGDKIAAITARAMNGELNFEQALTERVKMLQGLPVNIIDQTLSKMVLNKGAEELLSALKNKDIYCVLVSGGFTQFTSVVADMLGFDEHFGNELIVEDEILTGDVKRPILNKNFKQQKLDELQQTRNLNVSETLSIGDGANDLPMLKAAGLGVGYYPKPLLKDCLVNRIEHTDLSSLIYALKL